MATVKTHHIVKLDWTYGSIICNFDYTVTEDYTEVTCDTYTDDSGRNITWVIHNFQSENLLDEKFMDDLENLAIKQNENDNLNKRR